MKRPRVGSHQTGLDAGSDIGLTVGFIPPFAKIALTTTQTRGFPLSPGEAAPVNENWPQR